MQGSKKVTGAAHMRNDLRILLVANNVECRIVDSYKVPIIVSVTAGSSTRIMIGRAHLSSARWIFWIWRPQRGPHALEEVLKPSNNGI